MEPAFGYLDRQTNCQKGARNELVKQVVRH